MFCYSTLREVCRLNWVHVKNRLISVVYLILPRSLLVVEEGNTKSAKSKGELVLLLLLLGTVIACVPFILGDVYGG